MNEKIAGLAGDCKFSVSIVSSLMPSETFHRCKCDSYTHITFVLLIHRHGVLSLDLVC